MAGKADVQTHLSNRRDVLTALFDEWRAEDLTTDDRADIVEQYFKGSDVGETYRVGGGASLHVPATSINPKRPNVLVIGRHGIEDLRAGSASAPDKTRVVGPGLASRLAPTVAFAEGLQAARSLTVAEPLNMSYLSLSDGDSFTGIGGPDLFAGRLDAVFVTNAVSWSPRHPTITTGSRGAVVVQLGLHVGSAVDDYVVSGAVRNPLTTMTQILGGLRGERGRIAVPGFYARAQAPDPVVRAALASNADNLTNHDPNNWIDHLGVTRLRGNLSSLERAALWPGASVLSIDTDVNDGTNAPGAVTATVAFYLVPDQRHAEIEQAVREWFIAQAPADAQPTVRSLSVARPYRAGLDSVPVRAQSAAAYRLHGRQPTIVPAGGPAGTGELAFGCAAPVGFAGIERPTSTWGTRAEVVRWSNFDAAVASAAETCLQLRRA